jgi:polar amino acid transport system substrate-binding protein
MKKLLLLFILILTFFSQALCGDFKVLKSASDPWPPFIDPQNPTEGISLEIARAAYKTQGYKVEHAYQPWARAITHLKRGEIDIIVNTWMTDERKTFLMYSDTYTANEIKFIKLADDPFEFNGLDSLKGKRIGTVRGYGYGDKFSNSTSFTRQEVANLHINIKKLLAGRIDLTLEDEIVARVLIAQKDVHLLEKISFTNNALSKKNMYVTSGLANPHHKEYIEAFNKGLGIIKSNGTYNTIMQKYGIDTQ